MKVLELQGGKISLYETIKEMPVHVFAEFQKYLVQDAGIGSTMDDVTRHYSNMYKLLGASMAAEAATECYNLYQNLYLAINKINIEHICFVCFVQSVEGQPILDHSETNLRATSVLLGKMGLTQGHVEEILEDLKKKLMPS